MVRLHPILISFCYVATMELLDLQQHSYELVAKSDLLIRSSKVVMTCRGRLHLKIDVLYPFCCAPVVLMFAQVLDVPAYCLFLIMDL